MTQCDVTLILDSWPARSLHAALTKPLTQNPDQALALLDTREAGGSRVYNGRIYAGSFNDVSMDELQAFFMALPAAAWGSVRGIVTVNHSDVPGFVVNRVGMQA